MKRIFISACLLMSAACGIAQEAIPAWINNVKLSGYGMVQYQASDQEGKESNSFNLRMLRLSLEGRVVQDFYWKAQIQFNGNTSTLGSSPRVVDLFAEWQKYKAFRVKVGQFKRAFTFENPMHPVDQGFMSYSQNVSKLAGFSDRAVVMQVMVAILVYNSKATSLKMLQVANFSTIRWEYTTVRASM